jgi:hypothetical protein
VPCHEIRGERPHSSTSVVIVAAVAAVAAVVPVEEAGCTQDAESVEEVFVFGAAVAGIAVPSHREALSH